MHTYRIIQVHGVHGMADLGCRLLRDGKVVGCGTEREMLRLSEEMQAQDQGRQLDERGKGPIRIGDCAMSTKIRPCDEDCNHCPIVNHPNSRLLTKTLNELQDKFGNGVYTIVQRNCPNFTVCYDCRIDDFCHDEGCVLIKATT